MAIDVGCLEEHLMHMSAEGAPGREFCGAISELARTGRFAQLRDILPGIVYDELWARYLQDPAGFVAEWRMLAQEESGNTLTAASAHSAPVLLCRCLQPSHI